MHLRQAFLGSARNGIGTSLSDETVMLLYDYDCSAVQQPALVGSTLHQSVCKRNKANERKEDH